MGFVWFGRRKPTKQQTPKQNRNKNKNKKIKKKKKRKEKVCVALSVGLVLFKIFTTMTLNIVTQKLKKILDVFSKYSF